MSVESSAYDNLRQNHTLGETSNRVKSPKNNSEAVFDKSTGRNRVSLNRPRSRCFRGNALRTCWKCVGIRRVWYSTALLHWCWQAWVTSLLLGLETHSDSDSQARRIIAPPEVSSYEFWPSAELATTKYTEWFAGNYFYFSATMKDHCSWGILGEELRNFWWQVLEDFLIDKLVFFNISKVEILCGVTKIFQRY